MTVKELKEFLNNFPDDAEVVTEAFHQYGDDITYASLIGWGKENNSILVIGNSTKADENHGGSGKSDEYNLKDKRYIKTWNKWRGFKEFESLPDDISDEDYSKAEKELTINLDTLTEKEDTIRKNNYK